MRRLIPVSLGHVGATPIGQAYERIHTLQGEPDLMGAAPKPHSDAESDPRFEKVPAFYTATVSLGKIVGNTAPGTVQIRPEPFILKRITWASDGDVPPQADVEPGYSIQGRSVTISWSDEFTKFMGNQPALISALFGDSNGFIDLPRGALFQGSQALTINLTRLFWPAATTTVGVTRFDFVFQGLGLLPRHVHQSGSAG